MHISLDSALGQQRRLNQVGETISSIAAPTAAYSLRSLTGGDPKVVRVRRESDNHEQDFTASEVSSGALVDFVNTQVTAPLDIQALTATGRDGDFLIAKAAYSLRSLGTRQATVTSSGDTDGDTSGKFVCQVRRSSDDKIKSFTANEITDGTLLSFVGTSGSDNGFVRTWYDQSVTNQAGDTATGNHATQATAGSQPKIVDAGTLLNELDFDGSDDRLDFTALSASDLSIFSVVNFDDAAGQDRVLSHSTATGDGFGKGSATAGFFRASGSSSKQPALNITISADQDTLLSLIRASDTGTFFTNGTTSATFTESSTFGASSIAGAGSKIDGSVKEIIIYNTDQTDNRTAIEANIGEHYSISGIPAFDNSVNGFVETWYDQSGNGNDLTQATASKQPTIVTSGTLNTRNNEPIIKFIQANSNVLQGPSTFPPTGTDFALTCFQALHIDSSSGDRLGIFGSAGGGSNAGTSKYRFGSGTSRKITVRIQDASDTVTALESSALSNDTDSILTYMIKLNDGSLELQTFNLGAQLGSTQTSSVTDQSYGYTHDTILGSRSPSDNFSDSEFFEVLFYATDQLTNRDAIEANLSNKYGISLS